MSKPDAKLAALAEQHGLGAFRALFPYAAKNRNRLLWKLVGATAFTSLLFVGGIALFVDGELTPLFALAFVGSVAWWSYSVYALYKGWARKVQVHDLGAVYATHEEVQVLPWIDVVSVRMAVTEYVGAENYYEGSLDLTLRTDGQGTEFWRVVRVVNIPAEFRNIEQLMTELRRAEDIGRRLRKRLNPDRGVSRFEADGEVTYRFTEDLEVSPMNWEDNLGPLARLQTPEQRLTHHFYAQALFAAFNDAGQGEQARQALESLGYSSVGAFLRAYVTLLKYHGEPRSNPDWLETREWGELALRCDQAAMRRLQEDVAAGHQRLPQGGSGTDVASFASQVSRSSGHPRRPGESQRAA